MIQINKYKKKYDIALGRRNSPQYLSKLDNELKDSEWATRLQKLKDSLENITKASEFEEREKNLVELFNQLYEKITAPGFDAFTAWIESSTTSKNADNIKGFKKYLKGEYDKYADEIEAILVSKNIIDRAPDSSLFNKLLSNFDNKIKRIVTTFVDNNQFENEIDGLLETIKNEYNKVSEIPELSFTTIEQLFTDEQTKDPSLSFYEDIFEIIRKKHQSIDPRKGEDKNTPLHKRILNRILSVKKCISLLSETNISNCDDATLKSLFVKFQKEMPVVEDDYQQGLKDFIEKGWEEASNKYYKIKNFYSSVQLTFECTSFPELRKGVEVKNLIETYKMVYNEGDIQIKPSSSVDEIKTLLSKKTKSINDLFSSIDKCRIDIKEEFSDFIDKYNNQKDMLKKTIEGRNELNDDFDAIYGEDGYLDCLKNGIDEFLLDDSDLLGSLSQGALSTMVSLMKKTTDKFEETLKKTGLKDSLEWLNDLSDFNLSVESLDADKIKQLLNKGLITITLSKTYK